MVTLRLEADRNAMQLDGEKKIGADRTRDEGNEDEAWRSSFPSLLVSGVSGDGIVEINSGRRSMF